MAGLVIVFLLLTRSGFFETGIGDSILISGLIFGVLTLFLLIKKTAANPKALQRTKGLIVGDVLGDDRASTAYHCHNRKQLQLCER